VTKRKKRPRPIAPHLRGFGAALLQPVPGSPCPHCQRILVTATGIAASREEARPHPGAVTLCDQCGTWLVFTLDMRLRLATPEEIASVDPELRRVAKAIVAFIDTKRPKQ
jgi:RNase P subunit RPR2